MNPSRLRVLGRAFLLLLSAALPAVAAPPEPPQLVFPPIDPDALLARDAAERGKNGPLRFAEPIEVLATPQTDGRWSTNDDGSRTWSLGIQVPAATDLNFGFRRFDVPDGSRLTISDRSGEHALSHRRGDGAAGQLWTAVIPGDHAILQLSLPAGAPDPVLELSRIGAGYRDFVRLLDRPELLSGACNNDVVCPEGDPWRAEIRSAIKYSMGGWELCSGTLVMDVPRSWRPFVLTANHCGVNAAEAPSIVAYWNFQASTCGGPRNGASNEVTQSGATFRAAARSTDMALFELAAPPVAGANAYWAGWDRSAAPAPSAVAIHHPNLDEKAITFDDDALTSGENCIEAPGAYPDTHWYAGNYEDGTTEPGSSGSGIWNAVTHRLVGTLSGGYASCTNLDYDCWGKFARHWDAGGSAAQRLSDWLDPAGTGTMAVDGGEPLVSRIELDHADILDACALGLGDGNGIVEPGETITIAPWLTATGGDFATIRGTLDGTSPWMTLGDASATWPDLPAGTTDSSDAPHFQLTVDPATPCGTTIDLTLRVSAAGAGPFDFPLSLVAGSPALPAILPVAIPDEASASSTITVATDVTLTSVAVRAEVVHSYVGDLVLELRSPSGRSVTLLDRPGHPAVNGGCDAADMDVTFRDGSAVNLESTCTTTSPWYAGEAAPFQPLSAFAGERSAGTWTLTARDLARNDTGRIVSWELLAEPYVGECSACSGCPGQRIGESAPNLVRVRKGATGSVILTIPGPVSACATGVQVRRSTRVRPTTEPGSFPSDPAFGDVTAQDTDAGPEFRHVPPAGNVFYLVVEDLGGMPGPSGSYGF